MATLLPDKVPFAEKVPKKGAKCSTCDYLGKDGKTCTNEVYIARHGSNELGAKAGRWFCRVWAPEGGREG